MAGATMVQQPTNNALKQLFQDLNKVMVVTDWMIPWYRLFDL